MDFNENEILNHFLEKISHIMTEESKALKSKIDKEAYNPK